MAGDPPPVQELDRHLRWQAEQHVDKVRRLAGVELDYSPESLAVLDRLIDEWWGAMGPQDLDAVVFPFGAYVGEVIIRHLGGRWQMDEKFGIVVGDIGSVGARAMPIIRAGRRFMQGGRQASLAAYFEELRKVLSQVTGAGPASGTP